MKWNKKQRRQAAYRLGVFLREIRSRERLTLRHVAEQADIPHSYLSALEDGKKGIPTLNNLKRITDVYRVRLDEALFRMGFLKKRRSSGNTNISDKFERLSPQRKKYVKKLLKHLAPGMKTDLNTICKLIVGLFQDTRI